MATQAFDGSFPSIDPTMKQAPLPAGGFAEVAKKPSFGTIGDDKGKLYHEYTFGKTVFTSQDELTEDHVAQLKAHAIEQGAYDKDTPEEMISKKQLLGNKTLLEDFKLFHREETGKELLNANGKPVTDEEALDAYYSNMRFFESNLMTAGDRALKLKFNLYTPQSRLALRNMHEIWDKVKPAYKEDVDNLWGSFTKDPMKFLSSMVPEASFSPDGLLLTPKKDAPHFETASAAGTIAAAQITDPTNIPFILQGLAAVPEKTVAHGVAKTAVNRVLKGALKEGVIAGAENAALTGAFDAANQNVRIETGLQDKFNFLQNRISMGVGGVFGGTLGGVGGALNSLRPLTATAGEFAAETAARTRATARVDRVQKLAQAEKAWREGRVAAGDLHGPERAAHQAEINLHWQDALGLYMDDNLSGVHFKVGGTETPVRSVLTGEPLNAFMYKIGAKVEDDLPELMSKAVKYTPSAADDLADTSLKGISGHSQRSAVIMALNNSIKQRMGDALYLPEIPHDMLGLSRAWIEGDQEITKLSSEAGWTLNLMKQRHSLGFTPEEFDNLGLAGQAELANRLARTTEDEAVNITRLFGDATRNPGFRKGCADVAKTLNNITVFNMLGDPMTIARNLSGIVHVGFDMTERLIGGVAKMNPDVVKNVGYQAQAMVAHFDWKTASKEVFHTFLDNRPRMTSSNFMNENIGGTIQRVKSRGDIDLGAAFAGDTFQEKMASLGKELRGVDNEEGSIYKTAKNIGAGLYKFVGERLLVTSDEIISQLGMRSYVWADRYQNALSTGLVPKEARRFADQETNTLLAQHVANNVAGQIDVNPLLREAVRYSDRMKFQSPLEDGFDIGSIGKVFQKMKHPNIENAPSDASAVFRTGQSIVGTQVAPFIKTPANIVNKGYAYTPALSYLSKDFRRIMATGSETEQARATGALILGTMMWGNAAVDLFNGKLHGKGAANFNQLAIEQANGRVPESVDEGHEFFSIPGWNDMKNMMPFTFQPMVLAQISDLYQHGGPEALQEGIGSLALYTARVLMDTPGLTAIQGVGKTITDVSGATSKPEGMQKLGKAAGRAALNLIPGATLGKQLTKGLADDDFQKEAMTFLDAIKLNYPGLNTEEMGYKRDPISGIKLTHDFETGNLVMDAVHKREATDTVNREIIAQRLDIPPISPSYMGRDLRAYTNSTTKTPWYDRLQESIMEVRPDSGERYGGLNLYDAIASLMNTDEYKGQAAVNRGKTALSDGSVIINKNTKAELLKHLIGDYRELAYEKIGKELRKAASKGDKNAQDFLNDAKTKADIGITEIK